MENKNKQRTNEGALSPSQSTPALPPVLRKQKNEKDRKWNRTSERGDGASFFIERGEFAVRDDGVDVISSWSGKGFTQFL